MIDTRAQERPTRISLRPVSFDAVIRISLGIMAVSLFACALTGSATFVLLPGVLFGVAGAAYLCVFVAPSWLISIGLGLTVFSGNSQHLGLPIGPDRLFIAAGLASIVLGLPGHQPERRVLWRPLHAVLALVAAIAIVSAYGAGTLETSSGIFSLLDRLGLVPFLVFALAPVIYGTQRDRNALLTVLVVVGGYLGLTAILEGLGNVELTFPPYIADPTLGIHFGRARGPFLEGVANGLALYGCAVASAVAAYVWERPLHRRLAAIVAILCIVGTIFTLTRAVWLATIVATLMTLVMSPRTRPALVPIAVAGFVILLAALTFVPGFATQVSERSSSQSPLWDRLNTNSAAVRMIRDEPLGGIGWGAFDERAPEYLEAADHHPLTGVGIPVHNVPLSHAVEIGLIGASLWALGLLLAVGGATLRPGPEVLDPFRLAMVALFLHWLIVASFGPLGYAFPNLLLWAWAGIAGMHHISQPLVTDPTAVAA